jgi:hypothetical protein
MICYFCSKGAHKDCMVDIPHNVKFDGTSDVEYISCECNH